MWDKYFVSHIQLQGFRGIDGVVELGRGLNILIGPNSSGKTTVAEALAHTIILNYTDIRRTNTLLMVIHAARGSERHSFASIFPRDKMTTEACIKDSRGGQACVKASRSMRMESRMITLSPVVDISLEASRRECKLTYSILESGINISAKGADCFKETGVELGYVTPGLLPYNFFDTLAGAIKRDRPDLLEKITLSLWDKRFRVEVAADDWDRLAAYVVEEKGDNGKMVSFYSIGRGLQRALLLLLLLQTSQVVIVDEIESAMHPELLAHVAMEIRRAVDVGKQVITTTQSLEAARFMAASMLIDTGNTKLLRRPGELASLVQEKCGETGDAEAMTGKLNLIITDIENNKLNTMTLKGCDAASYILGTEDVRLSYTLLR